jgi:hypothetical protein
MVIKYFGPNDKTGVYWPPYSAAEKRQMEADLHRKPHSGPYTVVYPYARGAGPSLPGRSAAAVAASTNRHTEAMTQSAEPAAPETDRAQTESRRSE